MHLEFARFQADFKAAKQVKNIKLPFNFRIKKFVTFPCKMFTSFRSLCEQGKLNELFEKKGAFYCPMAGTIDHWPMLSQEVQILPPTFLCTDSVQRPYSKTLTRKGTREITLGEYSKQIKTEPVILAFKWSMRT